MNSLSIVIAALTADSAITAIVGNRVHAVMFPQGFARPCIVARLVSESEHQMTDGASGSFNARVSVECFADDAAAANDLGEAVKGALGDVTNMPIGDGDSPETIIGHANILKGSVDHTDISEDNKVFRRLLDFQVMWRGAP